MSPARGSLISRVTVLAAFFAWAAPCIAGPWPSPPDAGAPAPVILISIDTLRADHLSCYGYTRLRTPHIDSLARGGTLFAEVYSQAPITLASHVSLFTSTYPFANGIRENAQTLPPDAVTLATFLAARGYSTAAFIGGYFLARRYGLAQGFQTYDSPFDTRVIKGALDLKRPADQVLDAAEHWLRQNSEHPFLLFIHLFDLHEPYDPPAAYHARAPESEYDQELAYVDDSLGGFLEHLARRGLDQRALMVLFSDHGESLGDHGENTHGYFIYRSTLHVPLIVHWPKDTRNSRLEIRDSKFEARDSGAIVTLLPLAPPGATSGSESAGQASSFELPVSPSQARWEPVSNFDFRISPPSDVTERVDAPAGLIDVAPTVLSYLGIPPPASFCGHSLLALTRGSGLPPRDVYSESTYAQDKFGWAALRSLRWEDYQFIAAPRPELYDLKHDPAELHNLLPGQSALAADYRQRLAALVATYQPPPGAASASTGPEPNAAENLRSLGYLEITAPRAALDNSGVDPKDRLFEYKRYLLAGHLARIGKADEAAAEFQAILADDPGNLPASIELARADVALRRDADGATQLKAALALDPHNAEAEDLLADIWMAMGDLGRAAAEFHRLLSYAPGDYEAHFGLGLIAARQGRGGEAGEQFRAALAANPRSAEAHYQLALALEAQHQIQEAVDELRAALRIDPQYPDARRELAKLAAQPAARF